jgi:chaperone modulatory protein CbpM
MTNDKSHVWETICIMEEQSGLTLADLCRACAAQHRGESENLIDAITELVDEGVLEATGISQEEWRFEGHSLRRARVALRLRNDLGVNPAGAALALQLMEEIEMLRARLNARDGFSD